MSVASFAHARKKALSRGLAWELDEEEFRLLRQEPCWYCGGPLPTSSTGLDRFNEFEGYRLDNVAPCCWYCNTRRASWTPTFFRSLFVAYRARYGEFQWPGPVSEGSQRWFRQPRRGEPETPGRLLMALGRELQHPGDKLPWSPFDRTWQAWLRACRHFERPPASVVAAESECALVVKSGKRRP